MRSATCFGPRKSSGTWRLTTSQCVVCDSSICTNLSCSRKCVCGVYVCAQNTRLYGLVQQGTCKAVHTQEHHNEQRELCRDPGTTEADRKKAAEHVMAVQRAMDAGLAAVPKRHGHPDPRREQVRTEILGERRSRSPRRD